MKINIIPIKKLALLSAALGAFVLAFTPNAKALEFDDQHVVGTTTPGGGSESEEASYINFMINLAPGGSGTFQNQLITRSNNVFANLPTASAVGAVKNDNPVNDNGVVNIDLGAVGTYSYLFAKYDGQNDVSVVWYVGDLGGLITIPFIGPGGHELSHYTLFLGPGGRVPDGGTTVMLLGTALGALGMARRFLKR